MYRDDNSCCSQKKLGVKEMRDRGEQVPNQVFGNPWISRYTICTVVYLVLQVGMHSTASRREGSRCQGISSVVGAYSKYSLVYREGCVGGELGRFGVVLLNYGNKRIRFQ